jgi:hypothetical protein
MTDTNAQIAIMRCHRVTVRQCAQRAALSALVGSCLLLATAPVAAGAGSSSISGTVRHMGTPLQGIEAVIINPARPGNLLEKEVGHSTTAADGTYTVASLTAGSYKVGFQDTNLPEKYVSQFYSAKATFGEADLVSIAAEGEAKSGIDAELREAGRISGTVTDAVTHQPVVGITVIAFDPSKPESVESFGEAKTAANGEYTVGGLAPASYTIAFQEVHEPAILEKYLPQYYSAKRALAEADPVSIAVEGEAKTGINAGLQQAGVISGTVTDAVTHQPIAGVQITAVDPSKPGVSIGSSGSAVTDANGNYTISPGLASGTYRLEIKEPPGPPPAGALHLEETVNGVVVSEGNTTTVNVALAPTSPHNTSPPIASGSASPGNALSCSTGSWTGLPTLAFAYQWLRDGSVIVGVSGNSYVVQAADQGHGLACEVTATNSVGNASARSNTLSVAAPVLAPSAPRSSPASASVAVHPPAALAITSVRLTHRRFRAASAATAVFAESAPLGTRFLLTLSETANLRISIRHVVAGRRRGHRCVASTASPRRAHARICTRTAIVGSLVRANLPRGADGVPFSGRIGRRPLRPGPYAAVLTASNAGGRSRPVTVLFVIAR